MTSAAELPQAIGPYRVDAVLGRGAMSVVYRGHHAEAPDRVAAIKLLLVESLAPSERPGIVARFRREARLCQRMDHPNVVRHHDSGQHGACPYIAMELLEGRSLAEVLQGPRLAPRRGLRIALQLLDALAHVHALGVVHRDIKPANMILNPDDHLTLVDFGIAHEGGSDLTRMGDLLGSPAYMAPEQILGAAVDHRTDLFAAGVVLHALLTRQRAFTGTVAGVMQAILHQPAPPPSAHDPMLPPALDRIVERALAKAPERRFASAADFAAALRAVLPRVPDRASTVASTPAPGAAVPPAAAAATIPSPGEETLRPSLAPRLARAHAAAGRTALSDADVAALERAVRGIRGRDPTLHAALAPLLPDWPSEIERLCALIVADAPLPEASAPPRADWLLLVRIAAVSLRLLAQMGEVTLARSHHRRLAEELCEPFLVHVDRVGRWLAQPETPDLDRLSMGLFRLDVLEMALEALQARAELRLAQKTRTLVAIQAMRRVNDTVAASARADDRLARFDAALIMAEVEALLSIAGRLTDAGGLPVGRPLATIAQAVIGEFIAGAGKLAHLLAEELRATDPAGDGRVFAAKLRQLRALHHFAVRLPGQGHRAAVGRLAGAMHADVTALARELMARPGAADALSAVFEMAEGAGWQALAAEILRHLQPDAVPQATAV